MAKLSVRVAELAQPKLKDLKDALEQEEGFYPTSYEQVVSALVHGITLPMLRGMLREFNRDSAKAKAARPGADPPDSVSPPELHG